VVEANQVYELGTRIAQQFQPERIILFGAYVYGTPREDSDVDLLVVMPHSERRVGQSVKILNAVAPSFAVDLLVRTPEEMERRLAWGDCFLREVMEKGRVLYDASHVKPLRIGDTAPPAWNGDVGQ
jgi:predicted nucleotidyltransferase